MTCDSFCGSGLILDPLVSLNHVLHPKVILSPSPNSSVLSKDCYISIISVPKVWQVKTAFSKSLAVILFPESYMTHL